MDIVSALKYEVFRPFATTIVPGSLATGPYIFMAIEQNHIIRSFASDNTSAFVATVLITVIAAGLILEDLGSLVETNHRKMLINDRNNRYKREYKYLEEEWKQYLKLEIKDEIVGQRYLRTIHLRLKFELSMVFSLPASLGGVFILQLTSDLWTPIGFTALVSTIIIISAYMTYESYRSVRLLAGIRKQIVGAFSITKLDHLAT